MRKLAIALAIWVSFLALNTISYAADPTLDKTDNQRTVEKFSTLYTNQNFEEAAKLSFGSDNPEVRSQDAKLLKALFDRETRLKEEFYKENSVGILQSRELEPQTLITSREIETDKKTLKISAFLTEHHKVLMPDQNSWHFYWRFQYTVTLEKEQISDTKLVGTSLLMILNPEDCILPAVC